MMSKRITINTWYNCMVNGELELCKIVTRFKEMGKNGKVCRWTVITWYTGKDVFSGPLTACEKFIEERYIYG